MSGKQSFAARLRQLRAEAKMTQHELAERAGSHRQTIAQLETGVRHPTWDTVQALARALGVSCEAFQTAEPPPPSDPPPRPRGRPKKGGVSSSSAEAKPSAKRKRGQ